MYSECVLLFLESIKETEYFQSIDLLLNVHIHLKKHPISYKLIYKLIVKFSIK